MFNKKNLTLKDHIEVPKLALGLKVPTKDIELKIIGFLEKDTIFDVRDDHLILDDYINKKLDKYEPYWIRAIIIYVD